MYSRRHSRGHALVEHIILWPTLVLLTLGAIQLGFLYRDKATFNDAVFRAAREGALNHAYLEPMRAKLVEALVPLYQGGKPSAQGYLEAYAEAYASNGLSPTGQFIGPAGIALEIVSPTREIFRQFAKDMHALGNNCQSDIQRIRRGNDRTRCREERFRQIPNDNLHVRSANKRRVNIRGSLVDMNLQDANLLKVRAHWCAPLVVPLGASAFYGITSLANSWNLDFWRWFGLRVATGHPHWAACQAKTAANAVLANAGRAWRTYYIPLSSDSVVRMQSTVRCQGDEQRGRPARCQNLR